VSVKKKDQRWRAGLLCVALALSAAAVAGCGTASAGGTSSSGGGSPSGSSGGTKVAFLPKAINITYFTVASQGGQQAAKQLGGKFEQVGSTDTTAPAQIQWINTLIAEHVSAIALSANDPNALVPSLKLAMSRGIKVVTYDSDVAPAGRELFANQVTYQSFGKAMIQSIGQQIGYRGQIAILSTTPTATNQNQWISVMKQELATPAYRNVKLATIAYGQDEDQPSYTQTQDLLAAYPNLKGIIALSSTALPAAARALEAQGKGGKIALTGGSEPDLVRKYVEDGTIKNFYLWNVNDLGYLAYYLAYDLATGKTDGKPGQTVNVGRLGTRTIGPDGSVLLGPPQLFDKANINQFHF
jgi:rhamnose transport system substrate-binding protein